jgi:hypothetical protein
MKNIHPKPIRAPEDSCDREVMGRLPMPGNVFRRSLLLGLREYRRYAWAQSIQKLERCRWGAISSTKSTRNFTPQRFPPMRFFLLPGNGHRHQREAKRMRLSHGLPQGSRSAGAKEPRGKKSRGKEVNPLIEAPSKGHPHGLGNTSRSYPCRVPKSGTPRRLPVSKPWGRKKGHHAT